METLDTNIIVPTKNDPKRQEWLQLVGRNDLLFKLTDNSKRQMYRICEEHFAPSCIKHSINLKKKYLRGDAFPTLNLPSTHEAITKKEIEAAAEAQSENSSESQYEASSINQVEDIIKEEESIISDILSTNTNNFAISKTIIFEDQSSCSEQEDNGDSKIDLIAETSPTDLDLIDVSTNIGLKRKCSLSEPTTEKKVKYKYLENATKEDFLMLCDKFITKGMSEIIKWQIDMKAGHTEERQTQAFNFFALNIHYSGPVAYRFLKNTFCLPPLSTIKRFVKPIDTKIDRRLLCALKLKVDKMGPQERICSVCIGCMPVTPNLFYNISYDRIIGFHEVNGNQKPDLAKYFLVIMIRGIVSNWKQPIAHAFLSQVQNDPEVDDWIDTVITILLDIGLDIRVLVTDFDSGFVSASKNVSNNKTYFELNGHKIYYMFDAPQLIKCLKACLRTHNFILSDGVTSSGKPYNQNEGQEGRLLCHTSIDDTDEKTIDIKIPIQGLSNAIGTFGTKVNTNTNLNSNLTNSTDAATAVFMGKINNLNDLLNSSTLRSLDRFKCTYRGRRYQIDFLHEMLQSFNNLKFLKNDSETETTDPKKCIKGLQVSINSLLRLKKDLTAMGVKYIFTKRLNGGVLEKFFCKVRQSGTRGKQTCRHASNVFKKVFVCDILKTPSGVKCNEDFDSLITKQEDYRTLYSSVSQVLRPNRQPGIKVGTYDYKFDLPDKNALIYVSCYLYRKCISQHKCEKIKSYMETVQKDANSSNDTRGEGVSQADFLVIPPETFVSYVKSLEKLFREQFDFAENITSVGSGILKLIDDITFDMQCECFPIDYLKKLYARFRIYQTIKRNNELRKVVETQE